MSFVAVSYNIRHQLLDDGRDAWERRHDAVCELLRTISPEVLGLQESTGNQQLNIERALDGYQWYGVAAEPGSGEHNPVGLSSRFVAAESSTEWLSSTPSTQSTGWDAAYPRVLTHVLAEDTTENRSLAVYNAHFDHKGTEARRQSAHQIREHISTLPAGTECLVLGDFNCRPGSGPYDILSGDGEGGTLKDASEIAATVAGPATTITDFETLDPDRRIDHVFVTPGLSVDTYRTVADTIDGRYPSDHLPVAVRLRFA